MVAEVGIEPTILRVMSPASLPKLVSAIMEHLKGLEPPISPFAAVRLIQFDYRCINGGTEGN